MRFWVIGNGPSLRPEHLDMLKDEKTVALNRIHFVYDKTDWRPTIYVKTDHNPRLVDVYVKETRKNVRQAKKSYLWEAFKEGHPKEHPNHDVMPRGIGNMNDVVWIPRCKHHYYHHDNTMHKAQSWHLPEICTAFSGISPAIQIAFLEGATEIYLLGCDLGYSPNGKNHFDESYGFDSHVLGKWDNAEVLEAHKLAKRSCPVPIYNATIGGKLEVYPRVDFYEVINA